MSHFFAREFHYSLYASGMWEYILKAFWRVVPELEGRCLIGADTLWTQLRRMGINEVDNSHPVFCNIREAIQTLVKQRCVPGSCFSNFFSVYFLSIYFLYHQTKLLGICFGFEYSYLLIWRCDILSQENHALQPIFVVYLSVYLLIVQVYS